MRNPWVLPLILAWLFGLPVQPICSICRKGSRPCHTWNILWQTFEFPKISSAKCGAVCQKVQTFVGRRSNNPSRSFLGEYWTKRLFPGPWFWKIRVDDIFTNSSENGSRCWFMSGLCHLNRTSNVEIGVECQIFVIVIFLNCGLILQFWAHSRYNGALTQKR